MSDQRYQINTNLHINRLKPNNSDVVFDSESHKFVFQGTVDFSNSIVIGPTSGFVAGPEFSIDNAVPRFQGSTGITLKNSNVLIDDFGNVTLNSIKIGTNTVLTESSLGSSVISSNLKTLGALQYLQVDDLLFDGNVIASNNDIHLDVANIYFDKIQNDSFLYLDSNKRLVRASNTSQLCSINQNLSTTSSPTFAQITGTLLTPNQTNITSLGTLTGLIINGNLNLNLISTILSTDLNGQVIAAPNNNFLSNINQLLSTSSTPSFTSVSVNSITTDNVTSLSGTIKFISSIAKEIQISATNVGIIQSIINSIPVSTQIETGIITPKLTLTNLTTNSYIISNNNQELVAASNSANLLSIDQNLSSTSSPSFNNLTLSGAISGTNLNINATSLIVNGNIKIPINSTFLKTDISGNIIAAPNNVLLASINQNLSMSSDVTFNSVSTNSLAGTLITASQPNITSLGTLTALSINGPINLVNLIANSYLKLDASKNIVSATNTSNLESINQNLSSISTPTFGGLSLTGNIITNANSYIKFRNEFPGELHYGFHYKSGQTDLRCVIDQNISNRAFDIGSYVNNNPADAWTSYVRIHDNGSITLSGVTALTYLSVDSNKNIISASNSNNLASINQNLSTTSNVTFVNIAGTLTTANQPNVTSIGNLSSFTCGNVAIVDSSSLPSGASGTLYFERNTISPYPSRIILGDGTGWKLPLAKRTSDVTTDLFEFKDNGNLKLVNGVIEGTNSGFIKFSPSSDINHQLQIQYDAFNSRMKLFAISLGNYQNLALGGDNPVIITKDGIIQGTLHNNVATLGNFNNPEIRSGTYIPTITPVSNIFSATQFVMNWLRVGNVVTVSGLIGITTNTVNTTEIRISLPITSSFTSETQCSGTAVCETYSTGNAAAIMAQTSSSLAKLKFEATGTLNYSFRAHFTYLII